MNESKDEIAPPPRANQWALPYRCKHVEAQVLKPYAVLRVDSPPGLADDLYHFNVSIVLCPLCVGAVVGTVGLTLDRLP